MASVEVANSSPAPSSFGTLQDEINYYKKQYEHLESELQDFQASSRELESELEKDIEASEKRERSLREKVESTSYEAEEWKASRDAPLRQVSLVLTGLADQVQAIQDRGEQCTEHTTKGDNIPARAQQEPTVKAPGC